MNNTKIENILLTFGNRLLDVANNKENPTLGELIDEPTNAIQKVINHTTVKAFVYVHDAKYDEFTLGLSAGWIDKDGDINQQQKGAEDTFAIGMPVYDEQDKLIGNLSVGLFEHLDYAEKTSEGMDIPVYHWRVEGYNGKAQNIKTYYQVTATTPTPLNTNIEKEK